MTTHSHTPGPFAVTVEDDRIIRIAAPDQTYIAGMYQTRQSEIIMRDALLLAAAPEMLDALQIIARYAAAIEADQHAGLDWEFRNALGPVRAAIAKATGAH
jgi:hypothetical protein